jgi:predicted outer membrane protein
MCYRVLGTTLAMAVLVGACDDDDDVRIDAGRRDGGGGAAVALSDAEIAGVAAAINNAEIAQGQLALTRATNENVLDFANQMIDSHSEANEELNNFLTERAITPVGTTTSAAVQADAEAMATALSTIAGPSFDLAYIQSQITMHRAALEILQVQLIPSADGDTDLRGYLVDLRDLIAEHLDDAIALRADLDADIDEDLDEATEEALEADLDIDEDLDEATEEALERAEEERRRL